MDDDLCKCHCGIRVTVDEQLLEERQSWKQKYLCLQRQTSIDIGKLKQNIYSQCSSLMQQQFTSRQIQQNKIVNQKNNEIKNLTTRIINLETRIKILQKQNEILRSKQKQFDNQIDIKIKEIQNIKSKGSKSDQQWQIKLEQQITSLRKKLNLQFQTDMNKLETENEHLKHKIKQYQKKYQIILPEVQKLKNNLNIKNQQYTQLEDKNEKLKRQNQIQINNYQRELEQLTKTHAKCKDNIKKLNDKLQSCSIELQSNKRTKRQIKVEPVYIERPVQVQKIVQKIVQVQKIVTKFIEPKINVEQYQKQNQKLKEQISHLINQLHIFQSKYQSSINQYEECIKQYQENISKYKKQRQNLAKTIEQQNKQIQNIHQFIYNKKQQKNQQAQKIIVHVNKDGTYQKTVQKSSNVQTPTQKNVKRK